MKNVEASYVLHRRVSEAVNDETHARVPRLTDHIYPHTGSIGLPVQGAVKESVENAILGAVEDALWELEQGEVEPAVSHMLYHNVSAKVGDKVAPFVSCQPDDIYPVPPVGLDVKDAVANLVCPAIVDAIRDALQVP